MANTCFISSSREKLSKCFFRFLRHFLVNYLTSSWSMLREWWKSVTARWCSWRWFFFRGLFFTEAERASHSEVARAEKKRDREAVFVAPKEKKRKAANEDEYQVSSSYDSPFWYEYAPLKKNIRYPPPMTVPFDGVCAPKTRVENLIILIITNTPLITNTKYTRITNTIYTWMSNLTLP